MFTALFLLAMAATPTEPDAAFGDVLVVTAARQEQGLTEATALVSRLGRESLEDAPARVLDDQLRQVPGFTLFRRTGSLSAHPTTQGVSLRGIAGSGTSRSLVLFDGLPLNDPFGGWVYWNRLPSSALESVEVSRGATSQLYGSAALGGVVQLLPRRPDSRLAEVTVHLGDRGSRDAEAFLAGGEGIRYSLAGRLFDTDGFFILRPQDRGAVDRPARVGFGSLFGRVYAGSYYGGLQLYDEARDNGTELQVNDSQVLVAEGGFHGAHLSWSAYWQTQQLDSTFSRVFPGRDREIRTAQQSFPSDGAGAAVTWRRAGGLTVGADWRRAEWQDHHQDLGGLYAQKIFGLGQRLDLQVGGRLDLWDNRSTQTSFNPRLGLAFQASDTTTLRASVYRGFRAPTLNELFRPFRVGNVITDANPELEEESLVGAEVGVDFHPTPGLLARVHVYRGSFRDPVGNITLGMEGGLIRRQRGNLGPVRTQGLESELRWRAGSRLTLRWAYLYSDSEVEATGLRLPQVAEHRSSLGLEVSGPIRLSFQARWSSNAFEDDLNTLALPPFLVADLAASRRLGDRWTVFAAVENLFDREVIAGRLPLPARAAPRAGHLGFRLRAW